MQSDLSAASTRAELEPLAVRDLTRMTASPMLMDPWAYDRRGYAAVAYGNPDPNLNAQRPPRSPAVPGHRPRFVKSLSATSLVTDRLSDVRGGRRDRWSVITDAARDPARPEGREKKARRTWLRALRRSAVVGVGIDTDQPDDDDQYGEYEDGGPAAAGFRLHRYGRFDRALGARGLDARIVIPDRLHDTPLRGPMPVAKDVSPRSDAGGKDAADSVLSALTGDSDDRLRPRAMSESGALHRRSSFVAGKEKVLGVWDKLFRRSSRRGTRPPDRPNGQTLAREGSIRRSGKLQRLRSADRLSTRA